MIDTKPDILLSLVITSYTTEHINNIYELLDSVRNQTYKNMETIFVAERSKELLQLVTAYTEEKSIPNVKVVFNDGEPGLSVARNLGIKHAVGDIIGFTDDDALLFPDWAEQAVKALEDDQVVGVTGSAFPLWEDESLKWLPKEFYWLISCIAWTDWKDKRVVRGAFGANMAFQREAFADGCLFSPDAGYTKGSKHQPVSDDLEFSLRVRKKCRKSIIFSPGPSVWHRVPKKRLSWKFVISRSYQVGCTRRIIKKQYIDELGPFEQEKQVLDSAMKRLLDTPREFFDAPMVALKKLSITIIVLLSVAVGYLVPAPFMDHMSSKRGITK